MSPTSPRTEAAKAARALTWLVVAIELAATVPSILRPGMFTDGVIYAAVAHNLADGLGHFWQPHFSPSSHAVFYEQPPLGLYLESLAFRLVGDGLWVEKAAALVWGLAILALVAALWRASDRLARGPRATTSAEASDVYWALGVVVATPITTSMVRSNLLELPLVAFTLLALLGFVSARNARPRAALTWAALGSLATVGAVLSKGPQGLLPLAAPLVVVLVTPSGNARRRYLGLCAVAASAVGLGAVALVATQPDARAFVEHYLSQQVVASVTGQRETSGTRLALLGPLALQLVVPLASVALAAAGARAWPRRLDGRARAFLLLAAGAALPLFLSPKQHQRYLAVTLVLIALGLAATFAEAGRALATRWAGRHQALWGATATILTATLAVALAMRGSPSRDRPFFHDLVGPGIVVPEGARVDVCPDELADRWHLRADMQRLYRASLTHSTNADFYLVSVGAACPVRSGDVRLSPAGAEHYILYARHGVASRDR